MRIDPKVQKEKLEAAYALVTEQTTTFEKFEKIRILLKGIHPRIDKHLGSVSKAFHHLKKVHKGEIIELTLEHLPEDTKEQKKRKKALLLFLSFWKDLKGEVTRIKGLYDAAGEDGHIDLKEHASIGAKVLGFAKGPFALITGAAVVIVGGLALMEYVSVSIVIRNQGCDMVKTVSVQVPPIPGLRVPTGDIYDGGEAVATLPPLAVSVEGFNTGSVVLSMLGLRMEYQLQDPGMDLIFDGKSLLGRQTIVNLGSAKTHELRVTCK